MNKFYASVESECSLTYSQKPVLDPPLCNPLHTFTYYYTGGWRCLLGWQSARKMFWRESFDHDELELNFLLDWGTYNFEYINEWINKYRVESKYVMPKSCTLRAKCSNVHFLNHIKARTLPYVVRFRYWPQNFTHTSACWKTQPRHFSLRSQKEGEKECIKYFAPVHKFSWFWSIDFLCSLVLQKQTTRRPFCSSSTPIPPASNIVFLQCCVKAGSS